MEFSGSAEDHERRSKWMEKRTRERFRKKLKCEDLYSRSRSESPEPYRELLENYRKSQEEKRKAEESPQASEQEEVEGNLYSPEDQQGQKRGPKKYSDSESDDECGPKPLKNVPPLEKKVNYGSDLLPGEGDAMAQFVQQGKRIPRRGEVGLTSEQIENFEKIGYVMSGSRHKAINAMRIKKESMVLTAEQERQKALEMYQSRLNRENEIVNNLREMLRKKQEETEKGQND